MDDFFTHTTSRIWRIWYNMKSTWKLDEIKLDDLNELERELVRNIEKLDGRPKDLKRVANMVSTKISLVRALIHADRILENQRSVTKG